MCAENSEIAKIAGKLLPVAVLKHREVKIFFL